MPPGPSNYLDHSSLYSWISCRWSLTGSFTNSNLMEEPIGILVMGGRSGRFQCICLYFLTYWDFFVFIVFFLFVCLFVCVTPFVSSLLIVNLYNVPQWTLASEANVKNPYCLIKKKKSITNDRCYTLLTVGTQSPRWRRIHVWWMDEEIAVQTRLPAIARVRLSLIAKNNSTWCHDTFVCFF